MLDLFGEVPDTPKDASRRSRPVVKSSGARVLDGTRAQQGDGLTVASSTASASEAVPGITDDGERDHRQSEPSSAPGFPIETSAEQDAPEPESSLTAQDACSVAGRCGDCERGLDIVTSKGYATGFLCCKGYVPTWQWLVPSQPCLVDKFLPKREEISFT